MYFYDDNYQFSAEEILVYLRKSRSDDPLMTVEEVLERHKNILNDWIKRNLPKPIPEENYFFEVVSGESIDSRPEFLKIIKMIESPKIKAILCVDAQRLSRGDLEDCGRLIKLLRYTNKKVITPTKIFDLTNEYDREAFERELKRGNDYLEYYKKIQAIGKIESVKKGCYIGSIPPYGYDKACYKEGRREIHTLTPNQKEAPIVQMIFDMYGNQGIGLVNIAKYLESIGIKSRSGKPFTYSTLRDTIKNEHYIGKIKWYEKKHVVVVKDSEMTITRPRQKDYLLVDGLHEPLIDKELFYRCQAIRGQSTRQRPSTILINPFSGILRCQCGCAMVYRTYKTPNQHFSSPRFQCREQARCNTGSVLASELLNAVCDSLEAEISNFKVKLKKNTSAEQKRKEQSVATLEKHLSELEQKEIDLWETYAERGMPKDIFDKLKDKVVKEKEQTTLSLNEAKLKAADNIIYEEKLSTFKTALDALRDDNVSAEVKNRYLKSCIESITYKRERATRLPDYAEGTNDHGWTQPPFEINIKLKV